MERYDSGKANISSAGQEIHALLNSKFHYRFPISPKLVPILSHINLAGTLKPISLKEM
jgi:hypothetical protein